jgi:hypothetical protein
MQEKGENKPFLISCLPNRSHYTGHEIRLSDDNRHNRQIPPVAPTSVPAPGSKNGANVTPKSETLLPTPSEMTST